MCIYAGSKLNPFSLLFNPLAVFPVANLDPFNWGYFIIANKQVNPTKLLKTKTEKKFFLCSIIGCSPPTVKHS